MARFDTLPLELLNLIATFTAGTLIVGVRNKRTRSALSVPSRRAYRDLVALALTNRHFNRIFEPLLYRLDAQEENGGKAVGWAIERGSIGTLERALASGFDFNRNLSPEYASGDGPRDFPIFRAVRPGREPVLKWLLERGGARPDFRKPFKIKNFLHPISRALRSALLAAASHHPPNEEAALILLDHGASVFFPDDDYFLEELEQDFPVTSALHYAVNLGLTRLVERLLQDETISVNHRDGDGNTAFDNACRSSVSIPEIIELFLRHGADPIQEDEEFPLEAVYQAFGLGIPDNVVPLLRNITEDPDIIDFFSYGQLFRLLTIINDRSSRFNMALFPPDQRGKDFCQYKSFLSKLIEFGADFNNPPQPHSIRKKYEPLIYLAYTVCKTEVFTILLELGVDPLVEVDDGRTLFNVKWNDHVHGKSTACEPKLAALLNAGARIDVKDPRTHQTAIELAATICDGGDSSDGQPYDHDARPLQFLLEHTVASTRARRHIYEILDSRIDDLENCQSSIIIIMQHGWISDKARSYVFDWLISYTTFSSVREGLDINDGDPEFNQLAARFFPRFLNRKQLDLLWEENLASYLSAKKFGYRLIGWLSERLNAMPWWLIHAERNDVAAMELLANTNHPGVDTEYDYEEDQTLTIMATNDGGQTPLMRAIAAGSQDVAMWLLHLADVKDWATTKCLHYTFPHLRDIGDEDDAAFVCRRCPYGQRTTFEIALHRGEVEVLEAMWDLNFQNINWRADLAMPRVFSYSNVMVEWTQLRLGMKEWMKLDMTGDDAWLRNEFKKKEAKLRMEIVEIRDAWKAQAQTLEQERMDSEQTVSTVNAQSN